MSFDFQPSSKGLPLAVGDDFQSFDVSRAFRNFVFFCLGVVLAAFAVLSHAQTCDPVTLEIPWDSTAFEYAVGGGLLMFAVGFGVGLVINAVRKMRNP